MIDEMWQGFAQAIVTLQLDGARAVLQPEEPDRVGSFPFLNPVHIVTAFNPAGLETDARENDRRHVAFGRVVEHYETFPTIGSAPDGSFAEPGYGLVDVSTDDALDVARTFGQRAIYRWTSDALTILGVTESIELRLGWTLIDC